MRPHRASIVMSLLATLAAVPAASAAKNTTLDSPVAAADGSVKGWAKRNRGSKAGKSLAALVETVELAVPVFAVGDPRIDALRAIGAEFTWPEEPAARKKFKARTSGKKGPSGPRLFPLPKQVVYRFGYRELLSLDPKNRALNGALKKEHAPTVDDLSAASRLEAVLVGTLPETELIVAEIQRRLDIDPTADLYARFLETWRNWGPYGEESFYEALDRTAGTEEEVFFFDAMLGDFVGQFASAEGKKWPLQEQHDKNQQSFLAYRQYRGFIEAVSYAMVTPPDIDLPARLSRYDYGSVAPGLYSLRHQLDLMVAFENGDVIAVIDELHAFLQERPMPENLWNGFDPLGAMGDRFRKKVADAVFNRSLSADEIFETQRVERLQVAEKIRAAASAGL